MSLYAGPRTGMCAYTEDVFEVKRTFYIAFKVDKKRILDSGIVEVTEIRGNKVTVRHIDNIERVWTVLKEDFLKTANLHTDMEGNQFYGRSEKKWWQLWKR